MKKIRCILSIFLVCCIMTGLLPMGAMAADQDAGSMTMSIGEKSFFQGHAYQVFDEPLTWEQAKRACEAKGGHLATITSVQEQGWVEMLLEHGTKYQYWIGLSYANSGMMWVTGEAYAYTNWDKGQPDHSSRPDGQRESYAQILNRPNPAIQGSKRFFWNDIFLDNTYPNEESFFSTANVGYICEWDNVETGFTDGKDGWPFANARDAFGYPDGYRIPGSRYFDLYGVSLSSLILGGLRHIPEWNGNCFGMSLLSIAQYNGQVDMRNYFPVRSADGLYGFGYNDVRNITNGDQYGNIFSIAGNDDAIEMIERALISQDAQELKKAEVFSGDKTYARLLDYLSSENAKPLLLTLNFGMGGHAMVITNDERPMELVKSPGWYYIPLYDCNQPANSQALDRPYWWYTQEDSFLLVDTNSGKWQYWRDGSVQHMGDYSFLMDKNICFYDVSLLDDDFFTKPLTLWGNLIKIDFSGNDISITDEQNNSLFEAAGGEVKHISGDCQYRPALDASGYEGVLTGTLELPASKIDCKMKEGELAVWSEQALLSIAVDGKSNISIDAENCRIGNRSDQAGNLYLSLQENVNENYAAISLSGHAEQNTEISLAVDDGNVVASGTSDAEFNVQTETAAAGRKYSSLTPAEINGISIRDSDGNSEKTSFDSKVSSWAKREMEEAYDNGLIPAILVGEDLTRKIDRAEFAAVAVQLYEELSGHEAPTGGNPFGDIKGHRCFDQILKAYGLGITAGVSDTRFAPDTLITREQLAAMLCRTIKKYSFDGWSLEKDGEYYLDTSGVPAFADDGDISDYAKPSVYYLTKFGIIKGVDDTHFAPKNTTTAQEAIGYATATREQAVALSLRIFKLSDIWK